jgi:hypothetical protein
VPPVQASVDAPDEPPTKPVAVAKPVVPKDEGRPVVQAQPIVGIETAPVPRTMHRYEVSAFGLMPERRKVINARDLAGLYIGCTCWCLPTPCAAIHKLDAIDDHTLKKAWGPACCCCKGHFKEGTFDRDAQVDGLDVTAVTPNSFSNQKAAVSLEFGSPHGLCAGDSDSMCYMRVC